MGESALTVPLVAARAGVTPSTIYRRWGDLAGVLADVAVEHMQPDNEPPDTGSLSGDLQAWSEQYLEEMSSDVGRALIRDVLGSSGQGDVTSAACRCFDFTQSQIETMLARARQRGEAAVPEAGVLMDHLVAPIIHRLLFAPQAPDLAWLHARLQGLKGSPKAQTPGA